MTLRNAFGELALDSTLQDVVDLLTTGHVRDDYDLELVTPDQAGAGGVLTFDLGQAAPLITVDVDPVDSSDIVVHVCRVRLDGSDPTATEGHRCRSGQTTYLPFPSPTGVVKVWAPAGVTVSVQGGGRA